MFYESVTKAADGTAGSPGDKHYKCYHGARKVLTITRAMKSSLNGLQTHLRTKFPIMHRLYEAMSRRQTPPTQEEIDLARGASVMDAAAAAEYLGKVEAVTANIVKLFEAQVRSSTVRQTLLSLEYLIACSRHTQGDWDQAKFESLLTEWIVATDQPFDSVEQVEFRNLLQYTHHGATLRIPRRDAVRTRIMKLGEDTIEGMRLMFAVGLHAFVHLKTH
ncbi:hypothetical protein C8R47DRAFT_997278 [Mycena vitilis]|nr:hypothetical protein C8R47DRAFT_997278 [Mycena vitilis]